MKKVLLLLPLFLFAFNPEVKIKEIDSIIALYKNRIKCLDKNEANYCIDRYPQDSRSDAFAKTFCMSFPKNYYKALLEKNIKRLEAEKLCYGRSLTEKEAQECLKKL